MKNTEPKILFFDIENAPNLAYVWAKYEQNVIDYEKEWYMLCFAYKWLGQKTVKSFALPDFKKYKQDKTNDEHLIRELWKLFDEADVIIGHNSDRFDIRKSNARFIKYGLTPPSPYKTVDTKKVGYKHFMFNSNKLDDLGEYFGLGRKIKTDFDLWLGCMSGDKTSWNKMIKYNKRDVSLLERVYNKMLPWINNHPNVGMFYGTEVCPKCGSTNMQSRGLYKNKTTEYNRLYCKSCGGWSRKIKNLRKEKPLVSV